VLLLLVGASSDGSCAPAAAGPGHRRRIADFRRAYLAGEVTPSQVAENVIRAVRHSEQRVRPMKRAAPGQGGCFEHVAPRCGCFLSTPVRSAFRRLGPRRFLRGSVPLHAALALHVTPPAFSAPKSKCRTSSATPASLPHTPHSSAQTAKQ
jgi:hypothetical protein